MDNQRQNAYSAMVRAYLRVGSDTFGVAKINGKQLTLAEPCELSPGSQGQLVVIVDDHQSARTVVLPDGVDQGQREAHYSVVAPF
jgi:hypothetical protein